MMKSKNERTVFGMKFSIFKNDKSTYWNEIILLLIIIISCTVGILLIVYRPTFWIIEESSTVVFGVLITFFGAMFIPGAIYRVFHNDK